MKHLFLSVLLGLLIFPFTAEAQLAVIENPMQDGKVSGNNTYYGYACGISTLFGAFNGGARTPISGGLPRANTGGVCGNDGNNGWNFIFNSSLLPAGQNEFQLFGPTPDQLLASVTFENTPFPQEFILETQANNGIAIWQNWPLPNSVSAIAFSQSVQGPQVQATRTATSPQVNSDQLTAIAGHWTITIINPDRTTQTSEYNPDNLATVQNGRMVLIDDLGEENFFLIGDISSLLSSGTFLNPYFLAGLDTRTCDFYLLNLPITDPVDPTRLSTEGAFLQLPRDTNGNCAFVSTLTMTPASFTVQPLSD